MATNETVRDRDRAGASEQRFVATCDDCEFEDGVYEIEAARDAAADHKEATGHDVVALEVPAAR